ncbi:hypothetical protein A0U40_00665 [[Bacillus] sp. KCTC 13219]|nr:hypothetical protein A0U40_00665 [[Bacillus] sp. KCTC 13219]
MRNYNIKDEYYDALLKLSSNGYPKRKVIEEYKNGSRKAQENTVRAFADILGVNNWNNLVQ